MIDYVALAKRAALDDDLLANARQLWRVHSPDTMARNHERTPGHLRTSDAGRCVLELWAKVHDRCDLPESAGDLILKMNQGTLSGAWMACLIAAALGHDGYHVELEKEIFVPSIPPRTGHADIAVYREHACIEVVDCKWTAWMGVIDPPDAKSRYQCLSTGAYAAQLGAPSFVILTSAPAAKGEKMAQFRYDTDDWLFDIAVEYDRLTPALKDAQPEGDATDAWRCRKCRFSPCHRNVNPAASAALGVPA